MDITEENIFSALWQGRGDLIDKIIATGERDLARVLGLFQSHCQRYELKALSGYVVSGEMKGQDSVIGWRWVPRTIDAENYPTGTALPGGTPLYRWTVMSDSKTVRPAHARYELLPARHIIDLTRQSAFDAIVEIGSGIGERLFEVYLGGGPRDAAYFGAELWESGRTAADRLAALEPDMKFHSVGFDLKSPDFGFLSGYKRVLIFSSASIYSIERLPMNFIEVMAAAAPSVVGVHYELITGQLVKQRHTTDYDRLMNTDFWNLTRAAAKAGTVRLDYVCPDLYWTASNHSVTVIQWSSADPNATSDG